MAPAHDEEGCDRGLNLCYQIAMDDTRMTTSTDPMESWRGLAEGRSARCRRAELLILCARIDFNP